jgi:PAS domain S-box-containing protein
MSSSTAQQVSPAAFARRLWSLLPAGGSLPADVWYKRHRFLLGLTWFHAIVIALVGPVVGYSWELGFRALLHDGTVLHTIGEGSIVAVFALLASWKGFRRTIRASLVGFGLISSSAILVHLSGGYIELHFHFFVMLVFLALYQDWVPYGLAFLYIAIHHGVVGVIWPTEVYNHPAAINAPWTWAAIHAFFVLCSCVGSVIAWRFTEAATAQTKLILDSAGEGIYGVDLDGRATFVNPAAAKMLGYTPGELIGCRIHKIIHHTRPDGSAYPREECPIYEAFKDGTVHHVAEEFFWRKDGSGFAVDYESTPIFEGGELAGAVVSFRDMTERQQGERALRESDARKRAILESALDAVISMDHNGRIIEFNPAAERMFGYSRSEVMGKVMADLIIPPSLRQGHNRGLAHYLSTGQGPVLGKRVELTAMRAGGAEFPVELTVTPIDTGSLPIFTGFIRDITERKRAEEKLQARYKEVETIHEMGQIILRSPDLETVAEKILGQTVSILSLDLGVIRLLDAVAGVLKPVAVQGFRDSKKVRLHRVGDGTGGNSFSRMMGLKGPMIIEDVPQWNGVRTFKSEGVQSAVVVPVRTEREVLGVIQLGSKTPRKFQPDEMRLLEAIGNQIGVAVQKTRLLEEAEGRAKEQEALNVIAKATSQSLHLNELLEIALDKVLEVTGRERGSIRLKDPVTGEVRLGAHRGLSQQEIQGLLHTVSRQATDQVFASGQPLVVNDRPGLHDSQSLLPQSRSVAWIPMKAGAKVAGVLCVSTTRPVPFVQREVDLLLAIGNVIGVALENARLFQETEQRAQEQAALSSIAGAASQSLQIHEMLQNALDKTLEVTKRTIGIVRLKDDITGHLRVVAHKGISHAYANALDTEERIGQRALEVLTTGEVRIMEAPSAEDLMEDSRAEGVQSRLWVPVQAHGRIMGVLTVGSRIVQRFEPGEIELLKAIGNIFGTAVANSRLFEETQRNLRRIQALREIDQAITSTLDLHTVLDVLMEKIDLSLPYSTATLRLFNKESDQLEPVACRNLDEKEWKVEQWKAGRGPANVVFETKAPMMIRNCYTDPRVRDPAFFHKHALVSYLGLPMLAKDEILGVLSFYTKEEHEYTSEEVEFLTTLTGQAAIAIYNARLYEETERRRREAEELARVAQSLTGTLDIAAVGEQIVTSVRQLFGVRVSTLRLLQPDGSLRALASSGEAFSQSLGGDAMSSRMGLTGQAVAEGKPVWSRDMLNDPEVLLTDEMRDYQLRSGNRSMIAVPLRAHEKIIGALALFDQTGRIYSESEVALLRTFADQAALALENARLYEETRTREAQLQETNRELERANQVKNEFLSVMSHELRTPLNVITGYTSMIKEGMLGDTNPEQEGALEKVLNRTNDLLSMITSILYATSIEADEVHVDPHRFALGEFIDELRKAHHAPQNKPLTLFWDYPSDLPDVETDSEKLKCILQNLIHNAIKFTDSGHVTISARIKEGVVQRMGNGQRQGNGGSEKTIEFKVGDTGIGIPREKLPVIFEKFRQADSSETRVHGGVGLGLYIARSFTELLGGKIEVETEVGKGCHFTVSIPCAVHPSTINHTGDRGQQGLDQRNSNHPAPSGSSFRSGN